MFLEYDKLPTNQFGMSYKPQLGGDLDNQDWIPSPLPEKYLTEYGLTNTNELHSRINPEFSQRNKIALIEVLNELKNKDQLKNILEIGVYRSGEVSSSRVLFDQKFKSTKYFGIDLNEGCLQPVRNSSENIFCFCTNSSNKDQIMKWVNEHGENHFDLILVDGWHSTNQSFLDSRFLEYLSIGGVMIYHDVNWHPSKLTYLAVNPDMFQKYNPCENLVDDWGIGICKRIK